MAPKRWLLCFLWLRSLAEKAKHTSGGVFSESLLETALSRLLEAGDGLGRLFRGHEGTLLEAVHGLGRRFSRRENALLGAFDGLRRPFSGRRSTHLESFQGLRRRF